MLQACLREKYFACTVADQQIPWNENKKSIDN